MKREIKFRAWDGYQMNYFNLNDIYNEDLGTNYDMLMGSSLLIGEIMQYTGLKDKNGLQEVYEGDIIDSNGKIKGNIYQMDNGEADFVIQGFGTKTWCETYRRAILLGLKDSE